MYNVYKFIFSDMCYLSYNYMFKYVIINVYDDERIWCLWKLNLIIEYFLFFNVNGNWLINLKKNIF